MTEFIAYYRVSTDKQGAQGLGMDAQRETVTKFIGQRGEIAAEFVEVESGRKKTARSLPPRWKSAGSAAPPSLLPSSTG